MSKIIARPARLEIAQPTSQRKTAVNHPSPNRANADRIRFSGDIGARKLDYQPLMAQFPEFGPPPFNAAFHQDRRQALLSKLPPNTTLIIPGATLAPRNGDVDHAFRQESHFHYLTGFDEPDATAILSNMPGRPTFTLIVPPKDPAKETWTGKRAGVTGALQTYQADAAFENTQLDLALKDAVTHGGTVALVPTISNAAANKSLQAAIISHSPWPKKIQARLAAVYQAIKAWHPAIKTALERLEAHVPLTVKPSLNPSGLLDDLRLIKTPYELALLKRACDISAKGHIQAMQADQLQEEHLSAPNRQFGRNEGEIQAEAEHQFRRHGAVRLGYETIAGGGANACVLHYNTNREFAKPGDLELVDAGAEYGYYTADITRTWPISGKFTPEQKAIYDLVLKAQESGIQMTKPGVTLEAIHKNSVNVITQGLMELGILKGDPKNPTEVEQHIKDRSYAKYFMHGTSHWLGMDVHDTPLYSPDNKKRPLEPGMFFTVEPGIYIDPEVARQEKLDSKWAGIGVRIEDDILVTPTGHENFSAAIPRTTDAIEALMAQGKPRID